MLAQGETRIHNFLCAEDCLNTLKACAGLGAEVRREGTTVTMQGCGPNGLRQPGDVLDCGNSGTAVRLLSGVLAGQSFESTITGDEQIQRRPMNRIIEPLTQMGARIQSAPGGLCPLTIKGGHLTAIDYISPVASAQVKSCILLAGLFCQKTVSVTEPTLSRDHSERMLNYFGAKVHTSTVNSPIKPFASALPVKVTLLEQGPLTGKPVEVPADISSAAFLMAAAALVPGARVKLKNVGINATRTGILDVLRMMGASVEKENQRQEAGERVADLVVAGGRQLKGTVIYGAIIPRLIDELPIIAVAAAMAQGETHISDAGELRVKETDRISRMAGELRAIGVKVEEKPDGMIITGGKIKGGHANSHGDHRLAMSLAIAGLVSQEGVTIENTDCVNTSFSGFWELMEGLGHD
jgi:3-phosphoshikimate 1-carboxyvinyltransferase